MRIGQSELALLKHLQEVQPATARTLYEGYGKPKGLARTTVQTMLERLCTKGYVERAPSEEGVIYRSTSSQSKTLSEVIDQFVKTSLDGSLNPIASYLSTSNSITQSEIDMLKELIEKFEEENS